MARAPRREREGGNNGSRHMVWLSGLACGLVVAITPGLGLAAGGLLAPGLAALMLDKEAGRPIARAVLTCGVAGSVRPIMTLWNLGPTFDTALSVLFDPGTLVTAWGGAAAGWLLTQMAPLLTRMTLEAGAAAQTARLRATRARIADAWELDGDADEGREAP